MKKSEIKQLMKEAVSESLNESFVANIIEIVIRTTEKTIERKLDESIKKLLRKNIIAESKKAGSGTKKKIKSTRTKQEVAPQKEVRLAKDPIIDKMLKHTLRSTSEGELSEYGMQAPDIPQLGEAYRSQLKNVGNEGLNENVQIMTSNLSEDLGGDTLQGSVLDNSAIAKVFKKDYRKTLKKMEESAGKGLPEAVQFYTEGK